MHYRCFGRLKILNEDGNECLEVFWFHVQGSSIFPHGQNEEKEKNDEKGVSVKNWPLGGKVEMILCHLEEERLPSTTLHITPPTWNIIPPVNISVHLATNIIISCVMDYNLPLSSC